MDKRKLANQKVKERLLFALIEFSGQKDWSKVTITELIEKAGVARVSFYRNFKSIEEIVEYGILQMTIQYNEGKGSLSEDFHNRELMIYKFCFYKEHASLVLAFHHANIAVTLLDVITDCEIAAHGDMPTTSISKYELYYYSGAFYNMMLCWLENGMKETPQAMADEFLRMANGQNKI